MENSYPRWESDPGPSAYEVNVALLVEISIEHCNVVRVLTECAIKIYPYRVPRGRCSKFFIVCYILLTICSQKTP